MHRVVLSEDLADQKGSIVDVLHVVTGLQPVDDQFEAFFFLNLNELSKVEK
jgi:hypothetical protein